MSIDSIGIAKSTADLETNRIFKPHGQVRYRLHNSILYTEATGPFNSEIIPTIAQTSQELVSILCNIGPWAQIITYRESYLVSHVAIQLFSEYNRAL